MSEKFSQYRDAVSAVAQRALSMGIDGSPHRPQSGGPPQASMTVALPAARLLLVDVPDVDMFAEGFDEFESSEVAAGGEGSGNAHQGDGEIDPQVAKHIAGLVTGFETLAELGKQWRQLHVTDPYDNQPPLHADMPRMTDGFGHTRPAYYPLAVHLHFQALTRIGEHMELDTRERIEACFDDMVSPVRAAWRHGQALAELALKASVDLPIEVGDNSGQTPGDVSEQQFAITLWQAVCMMHWAWLTGQELGPVENVVDYVASYAAESQSLHTRGANQSPDDWTYRELVGLHALSVMAFHHRRQSWIERMRQVALFHVGHTQPDYTTYQPWACFAMAVWPDTMSLADQQLHDVQTHLAIEGAGGALLPGLLLADAVNLMDMHLADLATDDDPTAGV